MSTNKIEIKNLTVNYTENKKSFNALHDVSFGVGKGEFVSVIGASGCGKSTLLSVLEGLYTPAGGRVEIDGKELHGTGTERGVVFQHYSLFPWMTTRNNIAFGIKQARRDIKKTERLKIADEFLHKVGLDGFGSKYPSQLSGGMQQRAAIARALAMNTEILLMDEPFSAIDAKNRVILQDLLLDLWEGDGLDQRKTVVFVTHDIDEAILLSDKIVVLTAHPGTVHEVVQVPFERPRRREDLVKTDEYGKFRNKLLSLLYNDIAERIGGEEVVL
ncbi:MAG: Bicarbonate transport ATP-binding protein CmpD [Firmicutes bacterium ADurb.BinA205]|nr:MAG: Bicarbonate transport ATP-binding protein CmpD [Firmicutes bacterium ADurb.BinA205]